MNDVVERVARAIADQLGDDFDAAFVSKVGWVAARGESGGRFRDINEPFQGDYLASARAAIEAMREPTTQMLAAVDDEASDKFVARGRAYSAWVSMIDAALADASPDIGKEG